MSTVWYRARVLDVPGSALGESVLRVGEDIGLAVTDGVIVRRTPWSEVGDLGGAEVVELRDGMLLPGFVDTHVHFPQVRAIGGLGQPLLDWLQTCALPEEARMLEPAYAGAVAQEFLDGLIAAGTTSALVFGSHSAAAVDRLFTAAERTGMRITAGLVVGDRGLLPELHTDPQTAYDEGADLAGRWHGRGRLRYAVTPRFSVATTDPMLASCSALMDAYPTARFTSHINENVREIETVASLFPAARDYLDTYDRHGLVTSRSLFAHNANVTVPELERMAQTGASVAHCPTSNSALGSGLFPMRAHLDAGVSVALGSDVGAGTGFSLLKEGLQAYFMQQLLGDKGVALRSADLLYLATHAGARALDLSDVGYLDPGMQFDAVWVRPVPGSTFDTAFRHANDAEDALAKAFVLGTCADIATTWVGGTSLSTTGHRSPAALGTGAS